MGYGSAGIIAADYKTPRRWYNYSGASDGGIAEAAASAAFNSSQSICMLSEHQGVAVYSSSGTVYARSFTTAGTNIGWTGAYTVATASSYQDTGCCFTGIQGGNYTVLVFYRETASPYYVHCVPITITSAGLITVGTSAYIVSGNQAFLQCVTQVPSLGVGYAAAASFLSGSQYLWVSLLSTNGSTVSEVAHAEDTSGTVARIGICTTGVSNQLFICENYSTSAFARTVSLTTTSVTLNAETAISGITDMVFPFPAMAANGDIAVAFANGTGPSPWYACAFTISGTSVTCGTPVEISTSTPQWGGTTVYLGPDSDGYNYYGAVGRNYSSTQQLITKIFKVAKGSTTIDTSGPLVVSYNGTAAESASPVIANFTDDGYMVIGVDDTNAYLKVLTMFNS